MNIPQPRKPTETIVESSVELPAELSAESLTGASTEAIEKFPRVYSAFEEIELEVPTAIEFVLNIDAPAAMTVPLAKQTIKTRGCMFPEGLAALDPDLKIHQVGAARPVPTQLAGPSSEPKKKSRATCTRVRPPKDVVKLEDRLLYLLQPPLENIFSSEALEFPFHPFPYQFDGIAFMYPRQEAVLADEMGLGKTMQAIVAMRLLMQQGQVRKVLIICPKPLVTNWQREIALWAPELPVITIEGKQSRRQWLWENVQTGILLSNYESLLRDQSFASGVDQPFDLMIIDESQANTPSQSSPKLNISSKSVKSSLSWTPGGWGRAEIANSAVCRLKFGPVTVRWIGHRAGVSILLGNAMTLLL